MSDYRYVSTQLTVEGSCVPFLRYSQCIAISGTFPHIISGQLWKPESSLLGSYLVLVHSISISRFQIPLPFALVFFLFFWERIFLCSSVHPRTHSIDEVGLELTLCSSLTTNSYFNLTIGRISCGNHHSQLCFPLNCCNVFFVCKKKTSCIVI